VQLDDSLASVYRCCLTVVDGKPAVAYARTDGLGYVAAKDADGASWNAAQSLAPFSLGKFGDARLVATADGPAIAYCYSATLDEPGELHYIHALDPAGTTWDSPQVLDTDLQGVDAPSMAIVDGRPAVAFLGRNSAGDFALFYQRALDADGTAWGATVPIEAHQYWHVAAFWFVALAEVDNAPAVAYFGGLHLNYSRALDADGALWELPITVRSDTGSSGWPVSLADVGGSPCLLSENLTLTTSTDADGTDWNQPTVLDFASGWSLADLDGKPGISYSDENSGDLCFVLAP
jgi:hypothetical protein